MNSFKKMAKKCHGKVGVENEFFGQELVLRKARWNKTRQKLKHIRRDSGGALRLHSDNKMGFAGAGKDRLSPGYLVGQAKNSLKFAGEEPACGFCVPASGSIKEDFKDPVIYEGFETRLEAIENTVAAHLEGNEIQSLQVSYSENLYRKEIYRGGQFAAGECKTGFNFSAWAVLKQNDSVQSGFASRSFTDYGKLNFNTVLAEATNRARRLLGAEPPERNFNRFILTAEAASTLVGFVGRMFDGQAIVRGRSPFQPDKLNQKLGGDNVTFVDHPRRPAGPQNRYYDDEGGKIEKLKLFDKGIYKNFFTNHFAAEKSGLKNNHRSFRSYRSRPSVGRTNFYLLPGEEDFERMKKKLGNGPLVTSLQPGSGFNTISGNFSVGAKGYLLENGGFKKPFCSATLSGELNNLLNCVVCRGNKLSPGRATASPALLVENITLGGT